MTNCYLCNLDSEGLQPFKIPDSGLKNDTAYIHPECVKEAFFIRYEYKDMQYALLRMLRRQVR